MSNTLSRSGSADKESEGGGFPAGAEEVCVSTGDVLADVSGVRGWVGVDVGTAASAAAVPVAVARLAAMVGVAVVLVVVAMIRAGGNKAEAARFRYELSIHATCNRTSDASVPTT